MSPLPHAVRWLADRVRAWRAPAVGMTFEVVAAWPPAQPGLSTLDRHLTRRPLAALRAIPIVRSNLHALQHIPLSHATVLDVGCGTGQYQALLATDPHTAHWTYVGVDSEPACVRLAQQTWAGGQWVQVGAGQPLPFTDASVDVILASGVLQYCEDVAQTVAEWVRVSRGYVLITRLPVWDAPSQILVQHLQGACGHEAYPLHVLNRGALQALWTQRGARVLWEAPGEERWGVQGVQDPVTTHVYLVRKEPGVRHAP